MVTIVIDSYLKVHGLPKELFKRITTRLSYPNPKYENALKFTNYGPPKGMPKFLKSYRYEDGEIFLPRGYFMELLALLSAERVQFQIVDSRPDVRLDELPTRATPRGSQEKMIEEAYTYPGISFLLQGPPSFGKTFLGLEIARRERRKTLWITHTAGLLDQTIEAASDEIEEPRQVLGLPRKEIGKVGDGKFIIGDFLTVALIQSIKKLTKLKDEFGLVIVDECHHVPSTTWSKGIHNFNPYMTIGLTATAYRNDGLTAMLMDCIGPVVSKADKDLLLKENIIVIPDVKLIYTGISVWGKGFTQIVRSLSENEVRNQLILDLITRVLASSESNVMVVLTMLRDHVDWIYNACLAKGIFPIKQIGKMTKAQKAEATELLRQRRSQLIVATYKFLGEGFNYPPINHMLLATPFRNPIQMEQCSGRTQRVYPGKTFATIFDMIDDNPMLYGQANERQLMAAGLGMGVSLL
jgi:superfamily II DNA or RNA helicase